MKSAPSCARPARGPRENWASLHTLVEIRDDKQLDPEKRIKAAVAIMTLSGVTREKPRRVKRATLSVTRATPAEQARKLASAPAPDPSPEPNPSACAPGP